MVDADHNLIGILRVPCKVLLLQLLTFTAPREVGVGTLSLWLDTLRLWRWRKLPNSHINKQQNLGAAVPSDSKGLGSPYSEEVLKI